MRCLIKHKWSAWKASSTKGLASLVGAKSQTVLWRMCDRCGASEVRSDGRN